MAAEKRILTLNSRTKTEPIPAVAEIGIKDVEIGQVRFRLAAALRAVLDFKVQKRSDLPCDEWEAVARAALPLTGGATGERPEGPSRSTRPARKDIRRSGIVLPEFSKSHAKRKRISP